MGVQGVHGAWDAVSGEELWPPVGDTMPWGPWSHPLTFQLGPHAQPTLIPSLSIWSAWGEQLSLSFPMSTQNSPRACVRSMYRSPAPKDTQTVSAARMRQGWLLPPLLTDLQGNSARGFPNSNSYSKGPDWERPQSGQVCDNDRENKDSLHSR